MTGSFLVVGVCAIALGAVLSAVRRTFALGLSLQAFGAACCAVAGGWILAAGEPNGSPFTSALRPRLGVDGLSGVFLATMGVVAAPALVYSVRYLRADRKGRATGALTGAFLLVLALVLSARDPVTFLTGWELMTLLPAAVILTARGCDQRSTRTVFVYLAITHLGGVGTWISVLLLAQHGLLGAAGGAGASTAAAAGSALHTGSALQIGIALAALIGMGTKAGVMPLHVWLPRAHPIAPAPVSALMSGVMIKVAVYAMVRVLVEWVGVLPVWFGVLVLAVGAVSSVGGVVYAIFQHELKRLLALHSIENVGIIVLGLGACLVLRARGAYVPAAFALAAALLHTVNHAIFKALLFLGAGAFERAVGTLRLDRLGGLLRQMPRTGTAFLLGAMAISGLPPLNGFASEWSTMQALLRVVTGGRMGDGVAGAVALGALALTAALALLCFVKVVGLVLLGPSRLDVPVRDGSRVPSVRQPSSVREVPSVREAPSSMVAAMLFLAAGCVVLGLAPGPLFGALSGLAPWSGTTGVPAVAAPDGMGLRLPATGALPTGGVGVVLVVLLALLLVLRGRAVKAAAAAPNWACGQRVEQQLNWTSAGFTKPLRLVLAPVLRPRRDVTVRSERGTVQEVTYTGQVPELIDDRLYRPVVRWASAVTNQARRVQMGSLGGYAGYLIGLVVLLLGAARMGWFG